MKRPPTEEITKNVSNATKVDVIPKTNNDNGKEAPSSKNPQDDISQRVLYKVTGVKSASGPSDMAINPFAAATKAEAKQITNPFICSNTPSQPSVNPFAKVNEQSINKNNKNFGKPETLISTNPFATKNPNPETKTENKKENDEDSEESENAGDKNDDSVHLGGSGEEEFKTVNMPIVEPKESLYNVAFTVKNFIFMRYIF